MTTRFLTPFIRQYTQLPLRVRKKVDRQIGYLSSNIRHPGIHAKKMAGGGDIWEGRVDQQYRFTFHIEDDTIIFRRVGPHDILKKA